jgi:colanic acid/amylovoran biosynthesis protein
VALVAQVIGPGKEEDDRLVCSQLMDLMNGGLEGRVHVEAGPRSPQSWIGFYQECELVIATRAHAAIFSMCAGTPVVAVSYNPKSTGIMRDSGFAHLTLEISAMTPDKLILAIDTALSSRESLAERVRMTAARNKSTLYDFASSIEKESEVLVG